MAGEIDRRDQAASRAIVIGLLLLVLVLGLAVLLLLPVLSGWVHLYLSPGLGLKDAALIAFFVTVGVLILFALASGDGLLGELPFLLGAFFLFFVIFWLLLAWIF